MLLAERHVHPCSVAGCMGHGMWRMWTFGVCNVRYSTKAMRKAPLNGMVRGSAAFALGQQHPRMSKMPADIVDAATRVAKGVRMPELRLAVEDLLRANRSACAVHSDYYADEKTRDRVLPSLDALPRTPTDHDTARGVAAYVAWQMPLAYASVERVLCEVLQRVPLYAPTSVFDYGCGPGTAALCALKVFPTIEHVQAVDISENMLAAMREMWADCGGRVDLETSRFIPAGIGKHDLVMAAFTLSELASGAERAETLRNLWQKCTDTLVVVERGTPEGARMVGDARTTLLAHALETDTRLHIVAPCPHEMACPMRGSWCHFAQRLEMTALQMDLHAVNKGFEDQKLSYVVFRRGPRPSVSKVASSPDGDEPKDPIGDGISNLALESYSWPRLIRRPLKRQGHVVHDYCAPTGTFTRTVVSRASGPVVYRDARKARWGDLWPHPPRNAVRVLETLHVKRAAGKRPHLTIKSDLDDADEDESDL